MQKVAVVIGRAEFTNKINTHKHYYVLNVNANHLL